MPPGLPEQVLGGTRHSVPAGQPIRRGCISGAPFLNLVHAGGVSGANAHARLIHDKTTTPHHTTPHHSTRSKKSSAYPTRTTNLWCRDQHTTPAKFCV